MFALSPARPLTRIARYGLIGAIALMGASLVATVWLTNRGVDDASETLVRGQATVFRGAFRRLARGPTPVTRDDLQTIYDQHSGDGVRYVAVLSPVGGEVIAEVGDRLGPLTVGRRRAGFERAGDRVRMVIRPPPPRPDRAFRPAAVIIEFEPQVADELRAGSRRSLAIAAVAALVLLFIAIVLVRWYMRNEALERQLEHGRRLASLGEMSAVLAHEIRNPIASVKGNAQLLVRMLPDDDKPRAKAERLVSDAGRLEMLTNDLLEFARTGSIDRADTNPTRVLRAAARGSAQIEIEADSAPATWSLDEPRIRQVLTNLLDNAVEADDQPVEARVTTDRGALVFTIRDRGDGIDGADLERIFEPFYTQKSRGTGLGLAVARRIVELHGGTITAANAEDGGAEFRVSIPSG